MNDKKYIPDSFRRPFVDWLSFSVKSCPESFLWIEQTFGMKSIPMERGAFGYSEAYFTDTQALVAFSPSKPEHKVHVSLSSGALFRISENVSVVEIVSKVIALSGSFSRIDLAQDDYDGLLSMDIIFTKLRKGHVASRLRQFAEYRSNEQTQEISSDRKFTTNDDEDEEENKFGQTLYIGNMKKGRTFVRIYDKEAQIQKGFDHWIRVEFQLRHEAADNYCNPKIYIDEEGEIVKRNKLAFEVSQFEFTVVDKNLSTDFSNRKFSKVAYYYLKFLEPTYFIDRYGNSQILKRKHKRRWVPSRWWTDFLQTTKGESIGLPKNETGLEEIKYWALQATSGVDYMLTKLYGDAWIDEKETVGKEKFEKNKKYQTILKGKKREEELVS